MLARRKVAGICLAVLLFGAALMVLCPSVKFDPQVENCLIGLLTGVTSGALLALITTYCQQRIDVSRQKAMLFSWCKFLIGTLRQLSINFDIAKKYEVDSGGLGSLLWLAEGPGMQCANSICTAIDEDLFIRRNKKSQIRLLRNLGSEMGGEINQLHSQCEIIKRESEILRTRCQQKCMALQVSADCRFYSEEIEKLEYKIRSSSRFVCREAKKAASKYSDGILSAISVLYGKSEEARVSKIMREHERKFIDSAERMLRPRDGISLK